MKGVVSWWAVLLPAVAVGSFEFLRHSLFERLLPPMMGNAMAAILVGLGTALYVALTARHIRKAERQLSAAREETAVLQERDRIAREMHDNVSQALFYMGVRLEDLQRQMDPAASHGSSALLTELRQNLDRTYERVRAAIADLREHPAPRTLSACLERLFQEVGAQFRLQVHRHGAAPELSLPEPVLQQVLGVVQEALVNTAKHAGVGEATISVRRVAGRLDVTVSDCGRGFDPGRVTCGFGLRMMQERAEMAGGSITVEGRPGHGTVVRLEVPLEEGKA